MPNNTPTNNTGSANWYTLTKPEIQSSTGFYKFIILDIVQQMNLADHQLEHMYQVTFPDRHILSSVHAVKELNRIMDQDKDLAFSKFRDWLRVFNADVNLMAAIPNLVGVKPVIVNAGTFKDEMVVSYTRPSLSSTDDN